MGKPWTGADGGGCASPAESAGNIIYNHDSCVMQYCDSAEWVGVAHPHAREACTGACGAPAVGTVCIDGSVYAGLSPDGQVAMYTQRCDSGMSWNGSSCTGTRSNICWNDCSSGYTTTNVTSTVPGKSNTATLVTLDSDSFLAGTQTHNGAQTCVNLNEDGHTDCYLPAYDELGVLYTNSVAIGNFIVLGKANGGYFVRCVRR